MSEPWVLCVDDEERILDALEVTIGFHHDVALAGSGVRGLEILDQRPGCAVVVSDMRMPGMSGAEFLATVHRRHPDATRILLTGYSDLTDAVAAVNQGRIFRFLTKPCRQDELLEVVRDGIAHHRLRVSERELLEGTVNGIVELLVEVLAIAAPAAFERAAVIRQLVAHAACRLGWEPSWELELAAQLVRLGWIAVPGDVIERHLAGQPLSPAQESLLASAPAQASRLLRRIHRLDTVAELVVATAPDYDGERPAPASLLRAALDVDLAMIRGLNVEGAIRELGGRHEPRLLHAMGGTRLERRRGVATVDIHALRPGMITDEDVMTVDGKVLIRSATELTPMIIHRISNFHLTVGVKEPVRVLTAAGAPS